MKDLDHWLEQYGISHKNPKNKTIHYFCVPAIAWSLLGILHEIPLIAGYSLASLLLILALGFYASLNLKSFFVMLVLGGLAYVSLDQIQKQFLLAWPILTYLAVFTVAWIGQFIGHEIEGKKPSFFEDIQFLLIGPLWVLPKPLLRFIRS